MALIKNPMVKKVVDDVRSLLAGTPAEVCKQTLIESFESTCLCGDEQVIANVGRGIGISIMKQLKQMQSVPVETPPQDKTDEAANG